MSDMSSLIVAKSDQLNSDDLMAGPITIKIRKVVIADTGEQRCSVFYEGDDGKPYKPGKSMARVMVQVWGKDSQNYVGKSMTLYRDEKVTWGGMAVGGIRISHMSDIGQERSMALTATRGNKKAFTVKPLATPTTITIDSAPIIAAGDAAAAKGYEVWLPWWQTLTAEQKAAAKPQLARWKSETNKPADDGSSATSTQEDQEDAPI